MLTFRQIYKNSRKNSDFVFIKWEKADVRRQLGITNYSENDGWKFDSEYRKNGFKLEIIYVT